MIDLPRIVHVFGKMDRGGAEALAMNVYRSIDRNAMQFDFLVHTLDRGTYDDEIEGLGGRVFRVAGPKLGNMFRYIRDVAEILRSQGPFAAVHSHVHYFSGVLMGVAAHCGVKRRLCHSHTSRQPHANRPDGAFYRGACRLAMQRYSTSLLGCSRQTCEVLYGQCCWQDPRVEVIRNGITSARFKASDCTSDVKRHDTVTVAHVGNFTPPKNHSFIIRVFQAFLQKVPSAQLLLIGDGALRSDTQTLARELGVLSRVRFLGTRSDVPALLSQSDVVLFPSLWEGIPVSLVEAQACGIPCVVSDAISNEVDLGLGLLEWVKLGASTEEWTLALCSKLGRQKPDWATRETAIRKSGYEIEDVASRLTTLYLA